MMGYDSLLGSHYDKYYIDYGDYTVLKEIKPDVFNLSKGTKCVSISKTKKCRLSHSSIYTATMY